MNSEHQIPNIHESLVLGSPVDHELWVISKRLAALESTIAMARGNVESLEAMKNRIEDVVANLTVQKLGVSSLMDELSALDKMIEAATSKFLTLKQNTDKEVLKLEVQISDLSMAPCSRSLLDTEGSEMKELPLASDSMQMDSQFFSFTDKLDKTEKDLLEIEQYVIHSLNLFDQNISTAISIKVKALINKQIETHRIKGTLLIIAACTHKQTSIISPLVLDKPKAREEWNNLFPDDTLVEGNGALKRIEKTSLKTNYELPIISGSKCGSCFIGMIHLQKRDGASLKRPTKDEFSNIQKRIKTRQAAQYSRGEFSIPPQYSEEFKSSFSLLRCTTLPTTWLIDRNPFRTTSKEDKFDVQIKTSQKGKKASVGFSETEAPILNTEQADNKLDQFTKQWIGRIDQSLNYDLNSTRIHQALDAYVVQVENGAYRFPIAFYIKTFTKNELIESLQNERHFGNVETTT